MLHRVRRSRLSPKKKSKYTSLAITFGVCAVAALVIAVAWTSVEDKILKKPNDILSPPQTEIPAVPPEEEPAEEPPISEEEPAPSTDYRTFKGVSVPESEPVDNTYFDDAVFIGDSVTDGIKAYGLMKNATILANKGLNPSTMLTDEKIKTEDGYTTVIKALAGIQPPPSKIYILQGGNGISWMTKEHIMDLYGMLIDQVKQTCPNSIIYIQSIPPVTPSYSTTDNGISNEKIDEYNTELSKLAEQKGVYFVNISEAIKDENGVLPEEASPTDGMHFGPTIYNKWFDYLKSHTVTPAE